MKAGRLRVPDGLKAHKSAHARILQITDIMTRLLRTAPTAALSKEKAFAIMREEVKRGWWDGSILDEFERRLATDLAGRH